MSESSTLKPPSPLQDTKLEPATSVVVVSSGRDSRPDESQIEEPPPGGGQQPGDKLDKDPGTPTNQ
jgi:hypothetical protein